MASNIDTRLRARLVAAAALGLALLVGVGAYLHGATTARHTTPTPTAVTAVEPSAPVPGGASPVSGPERFARRAAAVLFDWDTATMNPSDVKDGVLSLSDQGEEAAGLASDVSNYLPDQATWIKLRGLATTQHLDIGTATVPAQWGQAAAQAAPGQLPAGAVAYTISGTRVRDGMVNDQPATYSAPVTFTVFIACTDSGSCRLLRLSMPDEPLK